MKKFDTLYKRSTKGKIQEWTISVTKNSYSVTEGIVDGKLTTTAPHTCEGKNPGKTNETTAEAQALKEAQAVWEKKLRKGYMKSIAEVDNTTFEKPMKGDKYKERRGEVVFPGAIQDKLNGVNFRIKKSGVLSTGCEYYYTVPHILEALAPLFKKHPGLVIVGEGYNPDAKFLGQLTEVMNVNIQPKDLTPELLEKSKQIAQCWVFDGYGFDDINKTTPWLERIEAVKKLLKGISYVVVEPYEIVKNEIELLEKLEDNRKRGGEGLMFRWADCPIKHGKSKYLLKLKHFEDAEFELLNLEAGNANWAGCAKRATLKLPKPSKDRDGNIITSFSANIRGDEDYLRKMLNDKDKLIGEMATVSYQCLSEWGIPQIPWLEAIRNYE